MLMCARGGCSRGDICRNLKGCFWCLKLFLSVLLIVDAHVEGKMGAEDVALGTTTGWGTWEELILGGAVLRHGTQDWDVVVSELRARTLYPYSFTPEICKAKYEDLQKRYSGSTAWYEELRKRRVAELKLELARSEDSIGSLESIIKSLEAEKQQSNQADYCSSQIESPFPAFNSVASQSFGKETPKDEQSAGSFTKDTRIRSSWACTREHRAAEKDTKPEASVSSKLEEELCVKGSNIRRIRGQRKRKNCNWAMNEGSLGDSDNLGFKVVSTAQKKTSTNYSYKKINDSGTNNQDRSLCNVRRENVREVFESIAQSEPAVVFRHRMDSQKRARYRKVIRQHVDMGIIKSRVVGQSIKSLEELFRDFLLMANNALVFYSRRTREYKSALSLRNLIMKEYKQCCRGEARSAFLPPVKPRSARPRPRPRPPPCKDQVLEKLSITETVVPDGLEKPLHVSLHSLMAARKGSRRQGNIKSGFADPRRKTSPPKQRKRFAR